MNSITGWSVFFYLLIGWFVFCVCMSEEGLNYPAEQAAGVAVLWPLFAVKYLVWGIWIVLYGIWVVLYSGLDLLFGF